MLPVDFDESNKIFVKPPNMTDEECTDLPTFQGVDTSGFPVIISCWKLSYEDLQEIQKTGKIWLSITGNGMPPVSVFTENPFK
jgi:hypothetical protein